MNMNAIAAMYHQLKMSEASYEAGSDFVTARCEFTHRHRPVATTIQLSHSDLNRIVAKIVAKGYSFNVEGIRRFHLEDGTEVVDYPFEQIFGELISLDDFYFQQPVRKVCA